MKKQVDLYRTFDVELHTLLNDNIASYSALRDIYRVYPETAVRVLTSCKEFRTLDDHAAEFIRSQRQQKLGQPGRSLIQKIARFIALKAKNYEEELPIPDREILAVQRLLETFVKDGFLLSKKELYKKVMKAVSGIEVYPASPENLRILGIPTRNRRKLLVRCVQSYLKNRHNSKRTGILHIADDSDEETDHDQTRQALNELCRHHIVELLWADRRYRQSFAREIAEAGGIPEDVTRFALLGDPRFNIRTGASRNTLLLLAAGELSVQVDDDTKCQVHSFPGMNSGIILSSKGDCNEYRFFDNPIAMKERVKTENIDFFSLHETLLGKHPGILLRDYKKLNIEWMKKGLLERLGQPDTRTVVTHLGSLGDSGMFRHWHRLCLEGNSFRQLVKDSTSYRNFLQTRHTFRGTSQTTITDGSFCMAMNIGLDTRRILPPFMPVQRNQDGIFGLLLNLGFKQVLRGYLPYAILHDPLDRPSRVDLSHALCVGPFRTNDVLEIILWSLNHWPLGPDPEKNLEVIGWYLSDLSQLSNPTFRVKLWGICWRFIRIQMGYLQQLITERTEAPDYWQRTARQVLANFQELLLQEDMCIPFDLPGSVPERLALFQDLVGRFGQLLIYWPAMWEASFKIHKEKRSQELYSKG